MKRSLQTIFGLCIFACGTLSAYHGEDNDPFEFNAYAYAIADQNVHYQSGNYFPANSLVGSNVQFGECHAGVDYHYLCSGCCEEYLLGFGYTYSRLHFKDNPYFKQDNFNAATMDLGAKWGCLCDWDLNFFWRLYLDTDSPNVSHYIWNDLVAWGRLKHRENLGLHLGTLIFTGMKINRMYPIFGFDWRPSEFLKVNAVFPVDMNITYMFCESFSAGIGARLIYSRHRVMKQDKYEDFNPYQLDQGLEQSNAFENFDFGDLEVPTNTPFPPAKFPNYLDPRNFARALWEYRAWGIEASIAYHCGLMEGHIYGGWSFNNHLTIGAHGWNHKQTFRLKAAPYIGADFMFRF